MASAARLSLKFGVLDVQVASCVNVRLNVQVVVCVWKTE